MKFQLPEIEKRGWKVWVLLFNAGAVQQTYCESGLRVEAISEADGFRKLLADAYRSVENLRPSVIVAHGYKEAVVGMCCSRKFKIPFIYVLHGAPEPHRGWNGIKLKLFSWLALRWARFSAYRIVAVSGALAKTLGLGSFTRTTIIYNVSSSKAQRPSADGLALRRPAIVAVGRFVAVKRFDLALRAFAIVLSEMSATAAKPTLYLVGDGPEERALRAIVSDLGISDFVELTGFRKDAAELIANADLFLLSSDSEGIPTVLLEALYAGTPVAATAVGGIPEVMKLLPGYPYELTKPGNAKKLAHAMQKMLRADRADLTEFGEVVEKHFAPSVAGKLHADMYREVCNE